MAESTELVVVRHGETEWNTLGRLQGQKDSPLTETGIAQARAAADALAGEAAFDAFYVSDIGRAARTGQIIAERLGLELRLESGLRERNFGIFEGLTWADIEREHPEEFQRYWEDRSAAPPGGETGPDRVARVVDTFGRIARDNPGRRVLAVTHGGVMMAFFKHVVGLEERQPRRFSLCNGAINRFRHDGDGWFLESWGEIAHLRTTRTLDDF